MALTRRDKEKIKKRKRSSLVFRKVYADDPKRPGRRKVVGTEKFSKADIRKNPNSQQSKSAAQFFADRDSRIDNKIKSNQDRGNDSGGLLSGISNAASNIGGLLSNDLVDNLAKISPILPFPLNVIGTGYNLYNLLRGNKEPTETFPIPIDKPNNLVRQSTFGVPIDKPDNLRRFKTPKELVDDVRYGGKTFDEPYSMLGGGSIPSVFSQPVGSEQIQTGVQRFGGRTRPTTETIPRMSTGLLDILSDANIGRQYQTFPQTNLNQPDLDNQLNVFPTAVDLGLLADANVGRYLNPQTGRSEFAKDIDFRLGVSPLEYNNIFGRVDLSDQLLSQLNDSSLLGGLNADINRNLAPATLENPIRYISGDDPIINNASANLLGYTPGAVGSEVVPLQDYSYRQYLDYQNSLEGLRDRAAGFPNTNINITGY